MPTLNDYFEFDVAEHFLPAIINDDYTGLNDEETNLLHDFLSQAKGYSLATWAIDDNSSNFIDCDVTGLFSSCYKVKLHFFNSSI